MPKTPSNYSNCLIYKLVCYEPSITDCYVGHTTNFKQRKSNHKGAYFNENHHNHFCPIYIFMREHGGWNNFQMLEIEKYPCEYKRQAELREEYFRKELKATLNGQQAFISTEEKAQRDNERSKRYNAKHTEEIKEKQRKYYLKNRDKILQQYYDKKQIHENNII